MNLACLVRREAQEEFSAGVFAAAKLFDNNFAFDYSGPWAPHNFVEARTRSGAVMLLVDDILCFPVTSILWIFREISKIAHEELAGEAQSITEQLRLLYMQLETGRITEQQFDAEEKLLLDRLDANRQPSGRRGRTEDPGTVTTEEEIGNP
jgi:hypothetical protein